MRYAIYQKKGKKRVYYSRTYATKTKALATIKKYKSTIKKMDSDLSRKNRPKLPLLRVYKVK